MKFNKLYENTLKIFENEDYQLKQCADIVLQKTHEYLKKGIKDFNIIRGKVYEEGAPEELLDDPDMVLEHYWILRDGKIEEPTPKQITALGLDGIAEYKPIQVFSPKEFIQHMKETELEN